MMQPLTPPTRKMGAIVSWPASKSHENTFFLIGPSNARLKKKKITVSSNLRCENLRSGSILFPKKILASSDFNPAAQKLTLADCKASEIPNPKERPQHDKNIEAYGWTSGAANACSDAKQYRANSNAFGAMEFNSALIVAVSIDALSVTVGPPRLGHVTLFA